jgi:hypothetical protein
MAETITREQIKKAVDKFKGKIKKLPAQPDTETLDFNENSDWFSKYCPADLWVIYYHKKEYCKY